IASLLVGTFSSLFWLGFVHEKEAVPLGISKALFGMDSILTGTWTVVDPILVATPLAFLTAIVVSLATDPDPREHIDLCFGCPNEATE
ncbi:MAG: sodium:solute symporter family protein, partial [Methanosarcinaceae archaeon]|nr:sodium:solute symporter family protein [Methanosarcinaceae archaeon]